jgi:hypothetical protein
MPIRRQLQEDIASLNEVMRQRSVRAVEVQRDRTQNVTPAATVLMAATL